MTSSVIGAQKAGTSALYQLLRSHNHLFFPSHKEIHFFDKEEATDWDQPEYDRYETLLDGKLDKQKAGEATPIYCYWLPCIERIKRYNAGMLLIMSIRDPAERAFSQWAMERARDREQLDFSTAIREGRMRVHSSHDSRQGQHRVFSYVERGFYGEQIARIHKLFPSSQLLVIRADHLWAHHQETLDKICMFLGIERFKVYPERKRRYPPVPRSNAGSISKHDRNYLKSLYSADIRETERLTGLNLSGLVLVTPGHWFSHGPAIATQEDLQRYYVSGGVPHPSGPLRKLEFGGYCCRYLVATGES